MDRNSTVTNLNFPTAEPSEPLPTSDETARSPVDRETVVTQEAEVEQGKRKRLTEDDGHKAAASRYPEAKAFLYPKRKASASKDGLDLQSGNAVPAKPSKATRRRSHGGPASTEAEGQRFQLPLTVKDESPWTTYDRDYQVELGGPVSVAERKAPAWGLVVVKQLSSANADRKLSMLRLISGRSFHNCIEIFRFEDLLHVVSEYMTMSLLQIVAAPRYPRESQVAAIISQILHGILFLESHRVVHGSITCSNVLVDHEGIIKIANQECCRHASREDGQTHQDVQALGNIMMQLMEKRRSQDDSVSANELHRWSPAMTDLLSETISASAKELLQHPLVQTGWRKEDLLSLISFAQISSRREYTIEP